jgi:hypothetical protein
MLQEIIMEFHVKFPVLEVNCHIIFPIENGLEQGDALLPKVFNFALECLRRSGKPGETEIEWDTASALC